MNIKGGFLRSNLSAEQKEEMNAQAEFDELKSAKTREIAAAKEVSSGKCARQACAA